jgi:hypothetical protein
MGEGEDEGDYFETHHSPLASHYIFRIDPHNMLRPLFKDENPRFDIPWQVATLMKEWAQYIVPLQF